MCKFISRVASSAKGVEPLKRVRNVELYSFFICLLFLNLSFFFCSRNRGKITRTGKCRSLFLSKSFKSAKIKQSCVFSFRNCEKKNKKGKEKKTPSPGPTKPELDCRNSNNSSSCFIQCHNEWKLNGKEQNVCSIFSGHKSCEIKLLNIQTCFELSQEVNAFIHNFLAIQNQSKYIIHIPFEFRQDQTWEPGEGDFKKVNFPPPPWNFYLHIIIMGWLWFYDNMN